MKKIEVKQGCSQSIEEKLEVLRQKINEIIGVENERIKNE